MAYDRATSRSDGQLVRFFYLLLGELPRQRRQRARLQRVDSRLGAVDYSAGLTCRKAGEVWEKHHFTLDLRKPGNRTSQVYLVYGGGSAINIVQRECVVGAGTDT